MLPVRWPGKSSCAFAFALNFLLHFFFQEKKWKTSFYNGIQKKASAATFRQAQGDTFRTEVLKRIHFDCRNILN